MHYHITLRYDTIRYATLRGARRKCRRLARVAAGGRRRIIRRKLELMKLQQRCSSVVADVGFSRALPAARSL